jgi:putative IMPACT (imprinted ancient) family translation regulator
MTDAYRILAEAASARLTRLRSRFIARLEPVRTLEEAEAALERIGREHHDASHVCSAYRLMTDDGPLSHSTDAGEPTGSAGVPILQALEAAEVFGVLAAVIRHYGGKKLGVGGLVRAYGDVTAAALETARIVVHHRTVRLTVRFPPEASSAVMGLIHRHPARVEAVGYTSEGRVTLALPPSDVERFETELVEASGARARVEELP